MKFLDLFKKLFGKKEDTYGTEKRRQKIERTLNAKILKDMEKEKYMRELIEKKREETKKADLAKKHNKTLSSNF